MLGLWKIIRGHKDDLTNFYFDLLFIFIQIDLKALLNKQRLKKMIKMYMVELEYNLTYFSLLLSVYLFGYIAILDILKTKFFG